MKKKTGMRIAAALLTLLTSLNIVICAAVKLPEKRALAEALRAAGDERYFSNAGVGEMYLIAACVTQLLPIVLSLILIRHDAKGVAVTLPVMTAVYLSVRLFAGLMSLSRFTPTQYVYTFVPALMRAAVIILIAIYLRTDRKNP